MNPITILKGTVSIASTMCVGSVVTNVIRSTTPVQIKAVNKAAIAIGSLIISDTIVSACKPQMEKNIDAAVDFVKKFKKPNKEEQVNESEEEA